MQDGILERCNALFKDSIESVNEYRGECTIVVRKTEIERVCRLLRDDDYLRFDSLRDLCGTDYQRPDDRFEVVYNLFSLNNSFRMRIKVRVDERDLHVPSITQIWPAANWLERETFDMFGIIFDGNPDLRRIFMPEEFEYFPLRKDFPLMGIPGSLTLPRK